MGLDTASRTCYFGRRRWNVHFSSGVLSVVDLLGSFWTFLSQDLSYSILSETQLNDSDSFVLTRRVGGFKGYRFCRRPLGEVNSGFSFNYPNAVIL